MGNLRTPYPGGYCQAAVRPRFLDYGKMRIPDDVLNSVVFIGTKSQGKFRPRATVFLVMAPEGPDFDYMHLVTAEHVIVGLFDKQANGTPGFEEIVLRFNTKSGPPAEHTVRFDQWRFHPDPENLTDVAVAPFDLPINLADLVHVPSEMFATETITNQARIGVGDEVSIVGLFKSHFGAGKNVPMANEPIYTRYAGYISGYLIEARSIGGLSGSPVWAHIPPEKENTRLTKLAGTKDRLFLLGLMHGHFDVQNLTEDWIADDATEDVAQTAGSINTGIGIVIPAQKILETLQHPELTEMRKKIGKWYRDKDGATADVGLSDGPDSSTKPNGPNPDHKEDFMRLLNAAATTKPSKGQT